MKKGIRCWPFRHKWKQIQATHIGNTNQPFGLGSSPSNKTYKIIRKAQLCTLCGKARSRDYIR